MPTSKNNSWQMSVAKVVSRVVFPLGAFTLAALGGIILGSDELKNDPAVNVAYAVGVATLILLTELAVRYQRRYQ